MTVIPKIEHTLYVEVALKTGTVLCRIASWECFGNAITHLLAVMKLRGNWVTIRPKKHSHNAIQHNTDPVSSATKNGRYATSILTLQALRVISINFLLAMSMLYITEWLRELSN